MRLVTNRRSRLNEKQTRQLLDAVLASEEKHELFLRRAKRWNDFFKGKQWTDEADQEHRAVVNLSYGLVQTLLPTIFFKEPVIDASPRHPLDEGKEEVWENVVNNSLPKVALADHNRKSVRDALIAGEGWSKLIFHEREDDLPKRGRGTGGPLAEGVSQLAAWSDVSLPVWVHVSPHAVIVDELSEDRSLENARFVAFRYLKDPDELRADPRYKDRIPADFEVQVSQQLEVRDLRVGRDKEETMVPIYEVWVYQMVGLDLYKQVVTLVDGIGKPIRGPLLWEELVGAETDWPIERLTFNEPMEGYPISEIEAISELQEFFNWAFSTIVNHLDTQKDIVAVRTDQVKEPNKAILELMESGRTIQVFETLGEGAIQRLQGSRAPVDAFNMLAGIERYMEQISGISEARQGGARSIRTATEAALVDEGVQIRVDDKSVQVERFLKRQILKWMRLVRQTVGTDRRFVMRLAGDTGSVRWFEFDGRDLDWEPDVRIEVGSFLKRKMSEDLQKWTAGLNALTQLIPILGPGVRIDRAVFEFLRALDLPAGSLIASSAEEQTLAMADLMFAALGVDVQPDEGASPQVRIQMIDFFLNSPAAEILAQQNPDALLRIRELRNSYQQLLLQTSQASPSAGPGSNPLDNQIFSPANQGRSRAGFLREATQSQQGNSNQFR